tara:strand:+ start:29780 stop:31546 length:1767 start_codon:yes stop_codon:yes gene_type:complete
MIMTASLNINFETLDEYMEERCGGKEYFLGCWSAKNLNINIDTHPENIHLAKGKNWFVLRNGADKIDGLIFPKNEPSDPEAVVFSGYLADQGLHSYSPADQVIEYWSKNLNQKHNGIFSAVTISNDGKELNIVTDIFGIGPVCYREVDDMVLFASAPGLLSLEDDKPDLLSWLMRLIIGYVPGKETLSEDVLLPVPASVTRFDGENKTFKKWYDHKALPKGEKVLDDEALELSEKALSKSIDRCEKIKFGTTILPFSSGHDSRRILAHLLDKKSTFEACTVQIPEPSGEDVDLHYASLIADEFNFNFTQLTIPDENEWHQYEMRRIYSLDCQTSAHTWSVRLFNHYDKQHACFYDGLGGDNFSLWPWDFDVGTIDLLPTAMPRCINTKNFPELKLLSWKLKDMYLPLTYGVNRSILTSINWTTRKSTSLWAQQQVRPGQIVLCPYLDIDYVETMLNYVIDEDQSTYPQASILKRFWPELAKYPCSRDFEEGTIKKATPQDPVDIGVARGKLQDVSQLKKLNLSFKLENSEFHFDSCLKPSSRFILFCSKYSAFLRNKIDWWLNPVVELMLWWQSRPFIIKINKISSND